MIDALDRDLLQIMARRMALVAEVAAYKRQHGVRIRDAERERSVLRDRHERAVALGLPAGEIESIFRVLLRSSRDHQAALRAEVPLDEPSRTVAIIGGEGKIGRLMARLFADLGHQLLIVDRDTALTAAQAAAAADVTVISVPIDDTDAVIREVGPHVRPDALQVGGVGRGRVRVCRVGAVWKLVSHGVCCLIASFSLDVAGFDVIRKGSCVFGEVPVGRREIVGQFREV